VFPQMKNPWNVRNGMLLMFRHVETYVTRVNVNKMRLLIKVVFDGVQVLLVNTDNTTR
jgi:hypothetical protein